VDRLRAIGIALGLTALALAGCDEGDGAPAEAPATVQARCDDACGGGWSCEELRGVRACTRACDEDEACEGGVCLAPEGRCAASSGRVGAPCSGDDHCHPGLVCLAAGDVSACSKPCGVGDGCPAEGWNVCMGLEPAEAGAVCRRRCEGDADCAGGLVCTWLVEGSYGVCFP